MVGPTRPDGVWILRRRKRAKCGESCGGRAGGPIPAVTSLVQTPRQAGDDGQAEPEALAPVALGLAQLQKLLKHGRLLVRRDADAGIPNGQFYPAPA